MLREIASQGVDIERRLTEFLEDLSSGIPEYKARGVKTYECDAWESAGASAIKSRFGPSSSEERRWQKIEADFSADPYYARADQQGKVAKYLHYFRRYLALVQELSYSEPRPPAAMQYVKELHMGDKYTVGQAGAVGRNATARDVSFQQSQVCFDDLDKQQLLNELTTLRESMLRSADTPQKAVAAGHIASAELSVKNTNGPEFVEHLKAAGKWAFDVATKIGTSVAAEAIKGALYQR